MSIYKRGARYQVRWRDNDGRHRAATFRTKRDAADFDRKIRVATEDSRRARRVREALDRAAS